MTTNDSTTTTTSEENETVLDTEISENTSRDSDTISDGNGSSQQEEIQNPEESAGTSSETQKLADQLARLSADHQNYVRRVEQEKSEMGSFYTEKFAKKILPTIDNLERVLTGTPIEQQVGGVFEGVKGAHAGLIKELESLGITSYSSVGQELDPNLHEALTQGPGPLGIITVEFEKGYMLGKKVIRHAKVVVGNGN